MVNKKSLITIMAAIMILTVSFCPGCGTYDDKNVAPDNSPISANIIRIPDLKGTDEESAKRIILDKQLIPIIEYEFDSSVREGLVIRSDPAEGTTVEIDSRVILYVSLKDGDSVQSPSDIPTNVLTAEPTILSTSIPTAAQVTAAATEKPTTTLTPTSNPTSTPTLNPTPTSKPKTTPTHTPKSTSVPTSKPTNTPDQDLDAILYDFSNGSFVYSACTVEQSEEAPWISIITDTHDGFMTFYFPESFNYSDYPYIAFKYRLGYGQSVHKTNHFYAITENGGPSPTQGMWADIDWSSDCDWHIGIFTLPLDFPGATGKWIGLRFPVVSMKGGELAVAWLGAFKNEMDVKKYDATFNAEYGDRLVKAPKPDYTDKEEIIPVLQDTFDETILDFNNYKAAYSMMNLNFGAYAFSVGANQSKIVNDNGNYVANIDFDALYYNGIIKSGTGYSCTFKYKDAGSKSNFGGFVFNWGDEQNERRDFYDSNNLEQDGKGSLVSASGCGVFFLGDDRIKVYIPIGDIELGKNSYISSIIQTGIDFKADYTFFKVEDNGQDTVTVSANDILLFSIVYSDPGTINNAMGYSEGYYRNTKIVDNSGNELASSDCALFSKYKSFAWAGRAHSFFIDDIQIINLN